MRIILLTAIAVGGTYGLLRLYQDLRSHWTEVRSAPGPWPLQSLCSLVIYFLAAFGVSDFVLSTILYTKTGWVDIKKLPGTLNTQPLIPVMITSLVYISSIQVDLLLLIPFLLLQVVGAYFGPRFSVRMPVITLKYVLSISLFVAGAFILVGKLGLMDIHGTATGLSGWKLILLLTMSLFLGALKTMGVGSYPLTMVLVYILGLSPLVTYPLMMGASALTMPTATLQFIRLDSYGRRQALLGCTAGAVGSLAAVFLVKNMDVSLLQWVVLVVVFIAAVDMFLQASRGRRTRLVGEKS